MTDDGILIAAQKNFYGHLFSLPYVPQARREKTRQGTSLRCLLGFLHVSGALLNQLPQRRVSNLRAPDGTGAHRLGRYLARFPLAAERRRRHGGGYLTPSGAEASLRTVLRGARWQLPPESGGLVTALPQLTGGTGRSAGVKKAMKQRENDLIRRTCLQIFVHISPDELVGRIWRQFRSHISSILKLISG